MTKYKMLYLPAALYLKHVDSVIDLTCHDYIGSLHEITMLFAAIFKQKDELHLYPYWLKVNEITLPFLKEHVQFVEVEDENN